MQPDSYETMAEALEEHALTGQMQRKDQLVVSCQEGPVWPNRGNSFWLSRKQGIWYLSTWLPAGYRVPEDKDILALCSSCMIGDSAMYRVPADVVGRFGLHELREEEYDRLFASD